MEKLEDQLMSAPRKLQRGMRWPVKIRKGPFVTNGPNAQISIASEIAKASSSSTPRYRTVLSILV